MALPRLQLRRGTGVPSGSIAIVAEPFFDTTGQDLYVATSAISARHSLIVASFGGPRPIAAGYSFSTLV